MATNPPAAQPAEAKPKKSTFETIIMTTPVLMTVIATLLAGLSSSEMTKAQYHRSLSGQNQSKVGDQWGFFQAKAVRRTQTENSVSLLHPSARPGAVTPEILKAHATLLTRLLTDADSRLKTRTPSVAAFIFTARPRKNTLGVRPATAASG